MIKLIPFIFPLSQVSIGAFILHTAMLMPASSFLSGLLMIFILLAGFSLISTGFDGLRFLSNKKEIDP